MNDEADVGDKLPPKPRYTAAKIAVGAMGLSGVLRLVSLALGHHKSDSENAASLPALTPSPENTCYTDCYLSEDMTNTPAAPADHTACEALCVDAKKKSPNMDFPQNFRRCRASCMLESLLMSAPQRRAEEGAGAGPRDAGRNATKGHKVAVAAQPPAGFDGGVAPDADKTGEQLVAAVSSCVAKCIESLATDGVFDPTTP